MGCLVTEDLDVAEEPFCPPSIVSPPRASHPLDRIAQVELVFDEGMAPDAGVGQTEEVFQVLVRDCNVEQSLDARIFVDARPEFLSYPLVEFDTIPPEGGTERSFDFRLTHAQLVSLGGEGCHRVELFVSGEFSPDSTREPRRAGDLAVAIWWVSVTDLNTEDPPELRDCP